MPDQTPKCQTCCKGIMCYRCEKICFPRPDAPKCECHCQINTTNCSSNCGHAVSCKCHCQPDAIDAAKVEEPKTCCAVHTDECYAQRKANKNLPPSESAGQKETGAYNCYHMPECETITGCEARSESVGQDWIGEFWDLINLYLGVHSDFIRNGKSKSVEAFIKQQKELSYQQGRRDKAEEDTKIVEDFTCLVEQGDHCCFGINEDIIEKILNNSKD